MELGHPMDVIQSMMSGGTNVNGIDLSDVIQSTSEYFKENLKISELE